ncbi:MAG: flagellar motor switch protein FliN [Gammaproteobacteria bacterium]|nr:MAG: flagellar motor switch protein FliN [Gammaproteobacteria bacterium]
MDEKQSKETGSATSGARPNPDSAGFRAASFQQVSASGGGNGEGHPSIDVILDVPVTLSLEVGRAQMSVGNLLRLSQGSVVELDRGAGEPLDVLVNGALVAHGEIVVVNDKFGIRLTDVVAPAAKQAG